MSEELKTDLLIIGAFLLVGIPFVSFVIWRCVDIYTTGGGF